MNKVNAIQKAVDEFESARDEANKKYEAIFEELRPKINYSVEKEVKEGDDSSKLTVQFGANPPFGRQVLLFIKTEHSSGSNRIALTPNEGKALLEILKELYE